MISNQLLHFLRLIENSAVTFRLLNKGEFTGNCFELCGQGHLSMSILGLVMF